METRVPFKDAFDAMIDELPATDFDYYSGDGGINEAKVSRRISRDLRLAVEKARKADCAPLLDELAKINNEAAIITERAVAAEAPAIAYIKAHAEAQAEEKAHKQAVRNSDIKSIMSDETMSEDERAEAIAELSAKRL